MTTPHGTSPRVRVCTRCAQRFTDGGPYLRGLCPSCITLVVTCWSESRYRHLLAELAVAAALREGPRTLVALLSGALARLPAVAHHAIYLRDARLGAYRLSTPVPGAPATLPSCLADALADCAGPVATLALGERDVRVASACAEPGWTMALPLRGEDDVVGAALFACAGSAALTAPGDLAYLGIVASAIGAGLARARAAGVAASPAPVATRRWDRATVHRLRWLL
jgi:hypothetical protein